MHLDFQPAICLRLAASRCLRGLRRLSGFPSGLPDLVLWVEARPHLSAFGLDQTRFLPTVTKRRAYARMLLVLRALDVTD